MLINEHNWMCYRALLFCYVVYYVKAHRLESEVLSLRENIAIDRLVADKLH